MYQHVPSHHEIYSSCNVSPYPSIPFPDAGLCVERALCVELFGRAKSHRHISSIALSFQRLRVQQFFSTHATFLFHCWPYQRTANNQRARGITELPGTKNTLAATKSTPLAATENTCGHRKHHSGKGKHHGNNKHQNGNKKHYTRRCHVPRSSTRWNSTTPTAPPSLAGSTGS